MFALLSMFAYAKTSGFLVGIQGGFNRTILKPKVDTVKIKEVAKKAGINLTDEKIKEYENKATDSSNNGFFGAHIGYLGDISEKLSLGGLVEGNFLFGSDIKNQEIKGDTKVKARFNFSPYFRIVFSNCGRFMIGTDLGTTIQEIRFPKIDRKTNKEDGRKSRWYWAPAGRLVVGCSFTESILGTAFLGGALPMIKKDLEYLDGSTTDSLKIKYGNWNVGLGVSYVFGG